ncbi:hypothetical protein BDW71DRAFT_48168 [Aspergillus fruticulosus]
MGESKQRVAQAGVPIQLLGVKEEPLRRCQALRFKESLARPLSFSYRATPSRGRSPSLRFVSASYHRFIHSFSQPYIYEHISAYIPCRRRLQPPNGPRRSPIASQGLNTYSLAVCRRFLVQAARILVYYTCQIRIHPPCISYSRSTLLHQGLPTLLPASELAAFLRACLMR